ncbi:MAG: SAM-dependent DNA methyltransferase [Promethearchaeota archaeon]|nr:MAG: SAM-dependent DNA methyltransferase [Candidatus Lokiarchaeota archaeon]
MEQNTKDFVNNKYRRSLGVHLTSKDIFIKYIFPEIEEKLWDYTWIDLYAGEGNLILPILHSITSDERIKFFKEHVFLLDIQQEMIQKCINNAKSYGIPSEIAEKNIKSRNNLASFPKFLNNAPFPLYHITNPPYLYLGYIRKHKETQKYLDLFKGKNEGYQDLYQIAMINDLRKEIDNLIYIIPSNFLFGASVSNKFRRDFLRNYNVDKTIIFETKIFDYTGTNICIGFFKRKKIPKSENIEFNGIKIKKNNKQIIKRYLLKPEFNYRAGSEFDEFLQKYIVKLPLGVNYYLHKEEVIKNKGGNKIKVIDANNYENNEYKKLNLYVNNYLKEKVESNIIYVRTVDTGSHHGRVGLGLIRDDFKVDGIYVSGITYRTHPIQIFFEPVITHDEQKLIKSYFNFILETFRVKLDSEFLTTYKYSDAEYTRKYLGLTQVRKLIQTFPHGELNGEFTGYLKNLIEKKDFDEILELLKTC